jgi:hypothetical protein
MMQKALLYSNAANHYNLLLAENDQLNSWESSADDTESWLLDKKQIERIERNARFRAKAQPAREMLARRF